MNSSLQFIDLGPLKDFSKRFKALQDRVSNRLFRFSEMQEHAGFWLFEDEDDEEIVGGILQINGGHVYAISEDVANLVEESFSRA